MFNFKYAAALASLVLGVSVLSGCAEPAETSRTASIIDAPITTAAETTVSETTEETTAEFSTDSVGDVEKPAEAETTAEETTSDEGYPVVDDSYVEYHFRTEKQLNQHFEKHGAEFDGDFNYQTPQDYENGASDVINNSDALFKYEQEDGDGVYYIESSNEFVILSQDGYIRTYFRPTGGKKYFDRQ